MNNLVATRLTLPILCYKPILTFNLTPGPAPWTRFVVVRTIQDLVLDSTFFGSVLGDAC